jgi:hypothetical protein
MIRIIFAFFVLCVALSKRPFLRLQRQGGRQHNTSVPVSPVGVNVNRGKLDMLYTTPELVQLVNDEVEYYVVDMSCDAFGVIDDEYSWIRVSITTPYNYVNCTDSHSVVQGLPAIEGSIDKINWNAATVIFSNYDDNIKAECCGQIALFEVAKLNKKRFLYFRVKPFSSPIQTSIKLELLDKCDSCTATQESFSRDVFNKPYVDPSKQEFIRTRQSAGGLVSAFHVQQYEWLVFKVPFCPENFKNPSAFGISASAIGVDVESGFLMTLCGDNISNIRECTNEVNTNKKYWANWDMGATQAVYVQSLNNNNQFDNGVFIGVGGYGCPFNAWNHFYITVHGVDTMV